MQVALYALRYKKKVKKNETSIILIGKNADINKKW